MNTFYKAIGLIATLLFFCSCDKDQIVGRDNNDPQYLMEDVGMVKQVNASSRAQVCYEVVTTCDRMLVITDYSQIYYQAANFRGFDKATADGLSPRYIVNYYYDISKCDFGRYPREYIVEKMYIYRLNFPHIPDITEGLDDPAE